MRSVSEKSEFASEQFQGKYCNGIAIVSFSPIFLFRNISFQKYLWGSISHKKAFWDIFSVEQCWDNAETMLGLLKSASDLLKPFYIFTIFNCCPAAVKNLKKNVNVTFYKYIFNRTSKIVCLYQLFFNKYFIILIFNCVIVWLNGLLTLEWDTLSQGISLNN